MKLDLTPLLPWLVALGIVVAAAAYLGKARFLSIWESEGVLSWRLLAATAVVAYALYMRAAERLTTLEAKDYLEIAVGLAALGTLKVVASRFAPKPTADPTEQQKHTSNPTDGEEPALG